MCRNLILILADSAFAQFAGWQRQNSHVDTLEPEQGLLQRVAQHPPLRPEGQQYKYWYCTEGIFLTRLFSERCNSSIIREHSK